ncbi:MAG: hypothetical protein KKF01_01235, partial [Proteobacteria bacterium]|nr:hypothetical protein [Pseudomonadota bacterium]
RIQRNHCSLKNNREVTHEKEIRSGCPASADNNRLNIKGYSSNAVALLLALNVIRDDFYH